MKKKTKPIIELKNVSRIYSNGDVQVKAVDNISLTVNEGEFIAIMGRSGSGKSTLMNMLGLLDTPSKGDYLLQNRPVQGLSGKGLARLRNEHFGFIFQSFNLLKRTTVYRNVELPLIYNPHFKGDRKKEARKFLKQVGLEGRLHHKSNQLSGGEQQRVAIARALVNKPEVVLADEPSGNLDTKTSDQIMKLIKQLNRDGKTVILVTHEEELAKDARRLIILKDGKIQSDRRIK